MARLELTQLEESLCQAYLVTKDKSEALRKSEYKTDGMKPATINRKAIALFDKDKIRTRMAELLEQRSERVNYKADDLLKDLLQVKEMDVVDILNDDGSVKPVREWPAIWRKMVSGFNVSEMGGGESDALVVLKQIKLPDKVKNLEMIGRHVDVQAWKERLEVEDKTDYADILERRANAAERIRNSAD